MRRIPETLLLLLWLVPLVAFAAHPLAPAGQPSGTGGVNAPEQRDKPYLVLVSIDGFRWDYQDRYPTPALDRIAAEGVRAERLVPVWPTLTFPNHYTIATGMYPARHGLVGNRFPCPELGQWYALKNRETVEDPRCYNGEPIWVTAETQGMVAAAFFFVGTEAPIGGVHPSHWRRYDHQVPGEDRVDQVLAWLAEPAATRPHLITLYFADVDDHAHWHGPDSPEAAAAVRRVDAYLARLLQGLDALPHGDRVNVVVVSDHGQGAFREDAPVFVIADHVDLEGVDIVEGGSYAYLHLGTPDPDRAARIRDRVNVNWAHGRAWLPEEAPDAWRLASNERFPDVILQPDPGYGVASTPERTGKLIAGDHGWAPEWADMHGVFLARGPNIHAGARLGAVHAVDVYPLLVEILELEPAREIDGNPAAWRAVVQREPPRGQP